MSNDTSTYTMSGAPASEGHKSGWVALLGPANAGKSTLLNALVGQKVSIVTDRPQTTRNQISGILTQPGCQVVFVDTPGVFDRPGKMNRMMQLTAWQALAGADMALVVLDLQLYKQRPELMESDMADIAGPIRESGKPVLVALNKIDLFKDKSAMLPVMERLADLLPGADCFPLSALREVGLKELLAHIVNLLPEGAPLYPEDQLSTVPMRFMAAEIVREKLFERLRQELPYSIAVDVEEWEELPEQNLTNISVVVYVARKNHKSMIIGKQGRMLKEVGTHARKELEEMLDHKVFLRIWVKVKEGWTEDDAFLRGLGYDE